MNFVRCVSTLGPQHGKDLRISGRERAPWPHGAGDTCRCTHFSRIRNPTRFKVFDSTGTLEFTSEVLPGRLSPTADFSSDKKLDLAQRFVGALGVAEGLPGFLLSRAG